MYEHDSTVIVLYALGPESCISSWGIKYRLHQRDISYQAALFPDPGYKICLMVMASA